MRIHIPKFLLAAAVPIGMMASAHITAEQSIAGLGTTVELSGLHATDVRELTVVQPDGDRLQFPVTPNATGEATVELSGRDTEEAGDYRLILTDGSGGAGTEYVVRIAPGSMDPWSSDIRTDTPAIRPDGSDSAQIAVLLRDRYGNVLPGRPVTLVSNRLEDDIRMVTTETDAYGEQRFSVSTTEPGRIQLRALDLLSGGAVSAAATVDAGQAVGNAPMAYETQTDRRLYYAQTTAPADGQHAYYPGRSPYAAQAATFDVIERFEITAPAELAVGEDAPQILVRAVDRNGRTVEDYVGTIRFASTDPDATLPNFGTYTFQARDLGRKEFPLVLRFRTPGIQSLRVEDAQDPSIAGQTDINVAGAGGQDPLRRIIVTSHENGGFIKDTAILIEGVGPRFANIIVMGGTEDVLGSTDGDGNFAVPITLNPQQRDFTIRVRDDAGRNDSGPVILTLDQEAPEIATVTFSPEQPQDAENTLVIVQSEPGLDQLTLRYATADQSGVEEFPLTENPASPGSYQAFFTAPVAGSYQPIAIARDKAGNVTEVRTMLTVGSPVIPQVQNVRTEPRVNAVALEWEQVEDDVDGYRVYVGEEPDNFLYTLDTERVASKATVSGLQPGRTYFFAITAIQGGRESEEKSDVVEAQVPGISLTVVPGDGALEVQWTDLVADLPLATYTLEYGAAGETLTERRTLNGELRTFTIRDLLNGIPYSLRLTPVTVTGDTLEELAATGSGTPVGSGFRPAANDPIPFDAGTNPGGTQNPAPASPDTGLPPAAWMIALAGGAGAVLYKLRRRTALRSSAAFLQAMEARYRA